MKGLFVPFQSNERGGVKNDSGSDHVQSIIFRAFANNASRNPFQSLDYMSFIFQFDSAHLRGKFENDAKRIFSNLESQHLAKLINVTWKKNTKQELEAVLNYVCYETNEPGELKIPPNQ